MPAYVIVDIEVHDPEGYVEYIGLAPETVAAFGGKYLARAGATDVLEGNWTPKRLVILEFPDAGRAREWLHSPMYNPVKEIRHRCARTNMVLIDGV